jgi:hypothetical protein
VGDNMVLQVSRFISKLAGKHGMMSNISYLKRKGDLVQNLQRILTRSYLIMAIMNPILVRKIYPIWLRNTMRRLPLLTTKEHLWNANGVQGHFYLTSLWFTRKAAQRSPRLLNKKILELNSKPNLINVQNL